ncbi:hypothetical protein P2318_30860 [Myxococcaceae bacterium GXIMD 01537]
MLGTLRLDNAFEAADVLRRFAALTGLSLVDDWLDQVRLTQVVEALLRRLGVR